MNDNITRLDGLLRISLLGGQARAFLADTTRTVETARSIHGLSRVATAALGRLLTGASIMGAMLKSDRDSVTLQVKGGGPIGALLAVAQPDASVKGYAAHPHIDIDRSAGGKLDVGAAVGCDGELAVIKDQGMHEPYIGRVALVSGEIGEDLAMYFTASEQTPSLVSLGVLTGDAVVAAGGLVIQPMPGIDSTALHSIEYSAPMFANISAAIRDDGLNGSLYQLLSHLEPEVIGTQFPAYRCDCSRERMERALISLGAPEIYGMIRERHGAELCCHFCGKGHYFTETQLMALAEEAGGNGEE